MREMISQVLKEFTDNDIYFMEVVSDKIIINDNYEGVLILDSDLNVIKKIKLLEDMSIDVSFVNNQEIVLYCYENLCLVHINIDTYVYKIISLEKDFEDQNFLSLYEWVDSNLFLLAEDGKICVHINLNEGEVQIVERDMLDKLSFSIKSDWEKLSGYIIHKIYPQRTQAVIETSNVMKIINYKNQEENVLEIEPFERAPLYFHDVEVARNCIVQISEKEISVYCGRKKSTLSHKYQHYSFMRGKFLTVDDKEYLLLLSTNNSSPCESIIEKYFVKSISKQ